MKKTGHSIEEELIWVIDQRLTIGWKEPLTPEKALQVVDELAKAVVQSLFDLLEDGSVPEHRRETLVQPAMIIRGST